MCFFNNYPEGVHTLVSVIALSLYSGGSSSDPEPDDGAENFTNGKSELDSCATPTEVRLSLERMYSVIITIHRTTFYCPRVLQDKKLNTGMHIVSTALVLP